MLSLYLFFSYLKYRIVVNALKEKKKDVSKKENERLKGMPLIK